MPFVNERVSQTDALKFELEAIDRNHVVGGTSSRQWTIDRSRDTYLRKVAAGREEGIGQSTWTLYWDGSLIVAQLALLSTSGGRGQRIETHLKLQALTIPSSFPGTKAQVLETLYEALSVYGDDGVYSSGASYELHLHT